MKKISMIVSAVLVMAAFASCKKDHTCTCSITANGQTLTQTVPMTKTTKKDAKSICNQAEAGYKASGATASCSLK